MKRFLILLVALFVTGCGTTEKKTESSSTEKKVEVVTEERSEEKDISNARITVTTAPRSVRQKKEELSTKELEEDTGEVDENGYGWVKLRYSAVYNITENHLTKSNGAIKIFGHWETWYSTNEAGGKETAVSIPGKHVADDGTIRDEDGYICVASSDLPFYSLVMTSVGPGKVYDCGCSSGIIDVYTTW